MLQVPKVETVVQDFYQAATGFQNWYLTFWAVGNSVLTICVWGAELTGNNLGYRLGGSIGSEICRQVSRFNPERIVLSRSWKIQSNSFIMNWFVSSKVDYVPVIADIQDYDHLLQVWARQPILFYLRLPTSTFYDGAQSKSLQKTIFVEPNVARAVDEAKVPKMVMISTDKGG